MFLHINTQVLYGGKGKGHGSLGGVEETVLVQLGSTLRSYFLAAEQGV
jgi:hypothetical protein